jgi:tetratricopeptide (TPR) repeat protein
VLVSQLQRHQSAGDPAAQVQCDEIAKVLREAGDLRDACNASTSAADAWVALGQFAKAEEALRRSIAEADALSLTMTLTVCESNLGHVLTLQGRAADGLPLLKHSLDAVCSAGYPRAEGWVRAYLSEALRLTGDLEGALREAEIAAERAATIPPVAAFALAHVAKARLDLGDTAGALEAARQCLPFASGMEEGETTVRLVAVEVHLAAGQHDEARKLLQEAAERVRARAESIADPSLRELFLRGDPNAVRTLELERELLG